MSGNADLVIENQKLKSAIHSLILGLDHDPQYGYCPWCDTAYKGGTGFVLHKEHCPAAHAMSLAELAHAGGG